MLAVAASILAVAAYASSVSAQDIPTAPANATEIVLVEAQYNASGFAAPIGNSQAFNITLEATALLGVVYGDVVVENGAAYSADQVANPPTIYVWPAAGSNYTADDQFTLMLADASALGNPDAEGDYRHYLANNVHAPTGWTAEQLIFSPVNDSVITYYAGPGPIEGTGAHRYAWLLFQQPSNFAAPADLSTAGVAPGHWSVESYVTNSGLGDLVAAAFFTVENGAPTVSAVSTSSVDVATLEIPSTAATTTGASTTGASAPGAANGAQQTGTTSSTGTGAASSTFSFSAVAGVFAAIAGGAVLFA